MVDRAVALGMVRIFFSEHEPLPLSEPSLSASSLVKNGFPSSRGEGANVVLVRHEKDFLLELKRPLRLNPKLIEEMQGKLLFLKRESMISRFHAMLELACIIENCAAIFTSL